MSKARFLSMNDMSTDRLMELAESEHNVVVNFNDIQDDLSELKNKVSKKAETIKTLEQQLAEANARIEMLEKSNEFLKSELEQIARFNPDWDRLEAAYDSIRDHMELTAQLNARIARFEDASNNLINVIPHMDGVFVRDCISDLQKALKESPQQSLALHDADVRAKAIKDFAYNLPFNGDTLTRKDVEGFMGKYIASGNSIKDGE